MISWRNKSSSELTERETFHLWRWWYPLEGGRCSINSLFSQKREELNIWRANQKCLFEESEVHLMVMEFLNAFWSAYLRPMWLYFLLFTCSLPAKFSTEDSLAGKPEFYPSISGKRAVLKVKCFVLSFVFSVITDLLFVAQMDNFWKPV